MPSRFDHMDPLDRQVVNMDPPPRAKWRDDDIDDETRAADFENTGDGGLLVTIIILVVCIVLFSATLIRAIGS